MAIIRTGIRNPLIIGKRYAIRVTYITRTEMYGELGWLKCTVACLRFRYKVDEKNNEQESKLLQDRIYFTLSYCKIRLLFK
jgi:hypothetical protein